MNSNRMDIRYLYGYKFVCQDKHYPKEACDVRSHYSTILSISSNKNCKTIYSSRYQRNTNKCRAEQAISSYLSLLRQKGHSSSQLGSTHDTGSEFGYHTSMDYMSLPKVVLHQLPSYQYRGFRAVSSLPAGDPSPGSLYPSIMSVHDCKRSCQTSKIGLENY